MSIVAATTYGQPNNPSFNILVASDDGLLLLYGHRNKVLSNCRPNTMLSHLQRNFSNIRRGNEIKIDG